MASHLVMGGSGFLGRALLRALGRRGYGTFCAHPFAGGLSFDGRSDSLSALVRDIPDRLTHVHLLHGIVNPDLCARDPAGSRSINVAGMQRLIMEAWDLGLTPVYLSTDYVFDGSRGGRTEDEPTCPTTEYGRQKAEMEAWLQNGKDPSLIARSSKIVSAETDTHSVIGQLAVEFRSGKAVRAAVDQIFSPMHVDDTAKALIELAEAGETGLLHVAGEVPFSRYDLSRLLADEIVETSPHIVPNLSRCRLAEIPFVETRPLNTSLSVTRMRRIVTAEFVSMPALCAEVAAALRTARVV
jgi:dTDP-4-dehydrorhamnose reductase